MWVLLERYINMIHVCVATYSQINEVIMTVVADILVAESREDSDILASGNKTSVIPEDFDIPPSGNKTSVIPEDFDEHQIHHQRLPSAD